MLVRIAPLVLLITACTVLPGTSERSSLAGTIWNLTELNQQPLLPNTTITTAFTDDGRVAGSSGCNNYTAAYELDDENIIINVSPAATTLRACPEPVMDQEAAYLEALVSTTTFAAGEEALTLFDASANAVAIYSAVSQDLAGTASVVTGYNNGSGGVVSGQTDTQITAAFGVDNSRAGNASCNEYSGPYETEGSSIAMGPFATTRKLCPDPIMDQGTQYLAALESAAAYRFDGITLNLRTADGATAVNMQPISTVSGMVTNADNAPIPEGAILTVQIQDTSRQDVAATVLGEQVIENPDQFPIAYEVGYSAGDITSPQYTMSARITAADGSLLFINDTAIPVITDGNPTQDVAIPVIQVDR